MYRDPTEFRERFKRWKDGKDVYKAGRPVEDKIDYPLPKFGDGKNIPSFVPTYRSSGSLRDATDAAARVGALIGGPTDSRTRALYNAIDPTQSYPKDFFDAAGMELLVRKKMISGDQDRKEWEVGPSLGDSVSDAAWRKRLGYPYNDKFLIPVTEDRNTVRLPKDIEAEIPIDTTMLKQRISDNEVLMKKYKNLRRNRYMQEAMRADKEALDSLRETYKTGKVVTINEQAHNNRNWLKNGYVDAEISPLNVLQNYQIWYDKKNNKMNYSDFYNFNQFDFGIPGKEFRIRGSIDLNRK